MNTDNMALSGETIDYGPCAFMDAYDPATVFSSIDHGGRYAYGNQPPIAQWNLARLAEAMMPLLGSDTPRAIERASAALDRFPEQFEQHWLARHAIQAWAVHGRTGRQGARRRSPRLDAATRPPISPTPSARCRPKVIERARFTQDDTQQGGGIEVRDHRRRRSSTRTATLSVGFEGFGGSFRSRRRRFALRISSGWAAYGTIRAIGVSRSRTVSVPPLRTDRRCSLRRAFSSAMPTSLMTNYGHERSRWSRGQLNGVVNLLTLIRRKVLFGS
jgi:hypothetical protein